MADDTIYNVIKGIDWFRKAGQGKQKTYQEKWEEAAEGPETPPTPQPPPKPENEKELQRRSTGGSSPFSEIELKKGYRKL